MRHNNQPAPNDARVDAIGKIWGTSVGLLAVSIPLVWVTKMYFLPLLVIAGAVFSTVMVWFSKQESASQRELELEKRVNALEERLSNIESMSRLEMRLAGLRDEAELEEARELPPITRL